MPNTYAKLYCHAVFSTKNRAPYINSKIEIRLFPYMNGTAKNNGCNLIIINGTKDHVHLLLNIPPRLALSDAMRILKSNSSKWIHETFPDKKDFVWQSGYAAFSVSHSNIQTVSRYIKGQKEHHSKISFKDELLNLLKQNRIDYEEKYLWD